MPVQATQALPCAPQLAVLGATHWPDIEQQPDGQLVESQTQNIPLQRWPG